MKTAGHLSWPGIIIAYGLIIFLPSYISAAFPITETVMQGGDASLKTITFPDGTVQVSSPTGGGGGATSLDELTDVVLTSPTANDHLIYNGTVWVNAPSTTTFSFSINTFSDSLAATIEEGNGVWKSSGTITFAATYNNGPPIGSTITFSGWSPLPMAAPFLSTMSIANVNFPTVGGTVVFTLTSQKDTTTDTKTITHTFNNDRYWGLTSIASSIYTSTDVTTGFGNSELSNAIAKTFTVTAGAGQYIAYAYPARLGTATFTVNGFSGGFLPAVSVSVTNGSGYVENFSVYRSLNSNLGTTTVVVTTP